MSPIHVYKMRAESPFDFPRAWQVVGMSTYTVSSEEGFFGDCEITFTSKFSLASIQAALRGVPDGHVMAETVALAEDYTGERVP